MKTVPRALKLRPNVSPRKDEPDGKPPAPPDMSGWQRLNPIDRLTMPRSVVQEMANAVPDHVMRDIVARGAIPGPSGVGGSGQVTKVSSNPGVRLQHHCWREATPLGPPPGVAQADRLMDAQDVKDRRELLAKEQMLRKPASAKLKNARR